jgi:uncharacterized protein (DUF2062 family)
VLRIEGSPERIALSFAVGVFIAFFPIFGIHTLLVILASFLFRLSFPLMLAGAFVNNPWTIVPMYAGALALGLGLTGTPGRVPDLESIFGGGHGMVEAAGRMLAELQPLLWPFVFGCLVLGLAAALLAYFGMHRLVRWAQRRRSPEAASPGAR